MTERDEMRHEEMRWQTMGNLQLLRRLARMTRPEKIRAFIKVANRRQRAEHYIAGVRHAMSLSVYVNDLVPSDIIAVVREISHAEVAGSYRHLVNSVERYLMGNTRRGITARRRLLEIDDSSRLRGRDVIRDVIQVDLADAEIRSISSVRTAESNTGETVSISPEIRDAYRTAVIEQNTREWDEAQGIVKNEPPMGQRRIKFRKKRRQDDDDS